MATRDNKPSKGEKKIIDLLNSKGVKWEREIIFNDLKGKKKNPLRFDFGIYSGNKLIALIEFDGEPHFKFIKFFHKTESNFRRRKEMD